MCANKYIGSKCRLSITAFLLTIFLYTTAIGQAQAVDGNTYKLTLAEAIRFAQHQNKWVQVANLEENAASEDHKDAVNAALPTRLNTYQSLYVSKGYSPEQGSGIALGAVWQNLGLQSQLLTNRAVFMTFALLLLGTATLILFVPAAAKTWKHSIYN